MHFSVLGIIPARGGSKGLKKKNIKKLSGKELIFYTIRACQRSKLLTDFFVSTDDSEIKEVCEAYGANVPFKRPPELSNDTSLAIPTMQHAYLTYSKLINKSFDFVMMLQPTSPLRTEVDIDNCIKKLCKSDHDSVISVVDVQNFHPYKMKTISDGRLYDFVDSGLENPPRQSLPKVFIVNGAVYLVRTEVLLKYDSLKGSSSLPYVMDEKRSINIDTEAEFIIAEHYLDKIHEK